MLPESWEWGGEVLRHEGRIRNGLVGYNRDLWARATSSRQRGF
ncbi:MAG: hypothetical protein R2750_05410 [Bacteroidales bacterium]